MAAQTFMESFRQAAVDAERPLGGLIVPRRLVLIAACVIVLLYASGIHGQWWPSLDSSGYLVLGRSIASGEGYRFNGQVDDTHPPGLPLLLAGVYLLAGENYWLFNGLITLSALGVLALMHACLKRITDPASALLLTVMTALGYRFFLNASRILSDMPMALLAWLAIYASMRLGRGRWAWMSMACLSSAGTVLFRAAGLLLMGALAVGVLLDVRLFGPWRRRLAGALALVLPALAVMLALYWLAHQVSDAKPLYLRFLEQTAGQRPGLVESYLAQFAQAIGYWSTSMADLMMAQSFHAFGWLLIALWLVGLAGSIIRREWFSPALCILYPLGLLLVTWVENAMRSRFLIVIQALLMLGALQGLAAICGTVARRARRDPQRTARRLVPVLVAILAIFTVGWNIPRLAIGMYLKAYAARTDRFYERVESGHYADVLAAADAIARLTEPGAVCLTDHSTAGLAHYRSRRLMAYWPVADEKAFESAEAVHSYAANRPELSAIIVPSRIDRRPSADGLPTGFDGDPAWRRVMENKSYVVYVRVRATSLTASTSGHRAERT
ncbi:MAG: ArnT family glycosyltransferase [Phycisphaerae bacterium]